VENIQNIQGNVLCGATTVQMGRSGRKESSAPRIVCHCIDIYFPWSLFLGYEEGRKEARKQERKQASKKACKEGCKQERTIKEITKGEEGLIIRKGVISHLQNAVFTS
jgi:hypothetical protein